MLEEAFVLEYSLKAKAGVQVLFQGRGSGGEVPGRECLNCETQRKRQVNRFCRYGTPRNTTATLVVAFTFQMESRVESA